MGFAKAFGLAELPQLAKPMSRPMGIGWLAAALAMFAMVVLYIRESQNWWAIGLAAVVMSEVVGGTRRRVSSPTSNSSYWTSR